MRFWGIGTAAVALALAVPASAAGTTWSVETGGGACTTADPRCPTIQAAHDAAAAGETINVKPGSWPGAAISKAGMTVSGTGTGEARVTGTLSFTGNGALSLKRLVVLSGSGSALNVTSQAAGASKTVDIQSSILSGTGSAAISVTSALAAGTIDITARHVTIADSGSAPATAFTTGSGGAITATFYNSIVKGPAPGATIDASTDTATDNAALFVDAPNEDYHLRPTSPAIDQGGGAGPGEIQTSDVDGETRGAAWDRGADEFVNRPPNAPTVALLSANPQSTGAAFSFGAQASDPDAARADSITGYEWDFGDGTGAPTPGAGPAFTQHAYQAAGTYSVRARAKDQRNELGGWSAPVTVTATAPPPPPPPPAPEQGNTPVGPGGAGLPGIGPGGVAPPGIDRSPPLLAITTPRAGQRVRLGRATPTLRGRTADESGVRRVELALLRVEGRRCLWYDSRGAFRAGPCTSARWFRAVLDDYDWRYAFPKDVRPRAGSYVLAVRATDYLGHASTAPPVVSFRYVP
jgi:hypothetical protein